MKTVALFATAVALGALLTTGAAAQNLTVQAPHFAEGAGPPAIVPEETPQEVRRIPMVMLTSDEIANPHLYHPRQNWHYVEPPEYLPPPPPAGVVRPAEFEEMDSSIITIINYGSAYLDMWVEMLDVYSEAGHTYIVASPAMQGTMTTMFSAAGIPSSSYTYLNYAKDTIWIRDYGPEFVRETDGTRHIIDSYYGDDRPNDDAMPGVIAASDWINSDSSAIELHDHDHHLAGGNIMTDGAGTCFFSDIIYGYEKPSSWTNADVDDMLADYYGCEQIIVLNPICLDGTGHIDLYAKMMGPTAILLGEFPVDTYFDGTQNAGTTGHCGDSTPNDHEDQEDNLATIEATTNLADEDWVVTRLHTLEPYQDSYGWVYRSYMNSQVFNGVVAMPSYYAENGTETAAELLDFEDQAIAAYEEAAPGVTVFAIDSDHIIPMAGAIHCIAHEIPMEAGGEWQVPSEYCGNGIIEGDEECDTWNTNYTYCQDLGFEYGDLACDMHCEFDTSDCGGGSDTDTDVDSDSDSDSDADSDADAGPTGGGGDDDCGCSAVGRPGAPSLLRLILG